MNNKYVTPFVDRQDMIRRDFEIFYRNDGELFRVPLHSHDFFELDCPLAGYVEYEVDGARYALSPGNLLLIRPGEKHRALPPGECGSVERIVLWLNANYILSMNGMLPRIESTVMAGGEGGHLIAPDPESGEFLKTELMSLLHEKQLDDSDSEYLSQLVLAEMMVRLTRCLARSAGPAGHDLSLRDAAIMRLYDYVGMHFADDLTVGSLAQRFFMDKNTLTRKFKRLTGKTPAEYIRLRRLSAARAMIRGGTGAQDAASQCGFSDYSAFYRAFTREFHESPAAFAKQREP